MDKDKVRILVLIDRYLPILGGAQNNTHEFCRELLKRHCSIRVLTRIVYPGLKKNESLEQIPVERMGYLPVRILSKFWFILNAWIYLLKNKNSYDVVLCVPCSMITELIPPWFASFFTKKPYVIRTTCYDNFDKTLLWKIESKKELLDKIIFPPLVWKSVFKRAYKIVCLSNAIRDRAKAHHINHAITIMSGVDLSRFKPASQAKKKQLRQKLKLPLDKIIIINLGRFVENKNQDLLIRAIESLHHSDYKNQLHLVLLGATEEGGVTSTEGSFKHYIESNNLSDVVEVKYDIGPVEDYLCAADIFVQPTTFSEGLSRVLMEAMATGLPTIATNLIQNVCIFPEGHGLFFEPNQLNELTNHLRQLLRSPKYRESEGQILALHAKNSFSLNRLVDQYEQLFVSIGKHDSKA